MELLAVNLLYSWLENRIDPFGPYQRHDFQGTLSILWDFIRSSKLPFAAMVALGWTRGVLNAISFYVLGGLVDLLTSDRDLTRIPSDHAALVLAAGISFLIIRPLVITLEALVGNQIIQGRFPSLVRWRSHRRVMSQSLDFFQKELTGAITSKVWQSGHAVSEFIGIFLQFGWSNIVYAGSTVILLATLDLRLGAVALVWIMLYFWTAYKFVPETRTRAKTSAEDQNTAAGLLSDVYSHIQTLFLFSPKASEDAHLVAGLRNAANTLSLFYRTRTGVRIVMVILSSVSIGLITVLTFILWRRNAVTVGDVALIIGLVLRLDNQLEALMSLLSNVFRAFGGFQSCMGMIAKPTLLQEKGQVRAFDFAGGRILFDNVTFGYGRAERVLESLSLSIEPGEKVGLVGASGAGKSTLLHLLVRFYDLESGRILIDGQDVWDVSEVSLRSQFGLVTQESSLLNRSIYENITCGREDVSEADVREAARQAHALEFIEALRDSEGRLGFDAYVGERGVQLSGGQRQRIAIARVFLKNAPILLLDEATSALDSKLDADIQNSLITVMRGKTVLAVAHRLSTLAHMDRLVVLHQGRIAEQGAHGDLLAKGGLYYELWQRQSTAFVVHNASLVAELVK
jgi:ATP-binding cassette subfamily B multidrug efflux pump